MAGKTGFAPAVLFNLNSPKAGVGGGLPHGSFGGPVGNVFYVNGGADGVTAGINAPGRGTKDRPFLTIAYAIAQCINDHDDYIIVWNCYNQEVTWPIVLDKDSIHIIGLSGPDGSWPALVPPGDTAVFTILGPGFENCEIAGFNLGGGPTHAAIELGSGANMTWIHHCTFGHFWHGGTCQDGVRLVAGTNYNVIIEDCWFYGNNGPNGKLTRYGIQFEDAVSVGESTIRRNIFIKLLIAMHLHGNGIHEVSVLGNTVGCGVDALGSAIDLGLNALACLVAHNEANHGDGAPTNNPYRDQSPADSNDWMSNQVGSVMKYPDEAM